MSSADLLACVYLVASLLFVFGLKGLSSPKTALRGNTYAMIGMGLALLASIFHPDVKSYSWIIAGLVAGAVVGTAIALKIQMTAMPQLVAALHSFVGLSAVLVAIGTFFIHQAQSETLSPILLIEIVVGSFIGAITFTGSLIAFGKLQEILGSDPLRFRGQHALNLLLGLSMIGFAVHFAMTADLFALLASTVIAFILGFLLILPIGGADMPVVVSMLNSYSGWAAAATGFTLENNLLITTGALVGSSGAILSFIMCKAMNRGFLSVILGGFGGSESETSAEQAAGQRAGQGKSQKRAKSASAEDVAFMLSNSSKVIIVPGYGMAVAQAQHAVKELVEVLNKKNIEVKFAIHPVAGRMPGHMNVLLAESEIPYDIVFEMEEINSEFSTADVTFVIGANDVVNPDAKTDKTSPLYGMPILDVYKSRQIYVSKRSMKPGYAGVDNALFYYDNCALVFGDAKSTCDTIAANLHES